MKKDTNLDMLIKCTDLSLHFRAKIKDGSIKDEIIAQEEAKGSKLLTQWNII